MAVKGFLSDIEEKQVVDAIYSAEKTTSGEIRLHIENRCKGDVIERAKVVFAQLNMQKTKERNGILLYIALLDHKVAIWGDEGIHSKVGQSFWDSEVNRLVQAFKNQEYKQGLITVISEIGSKLGELFPYQDNDSNELDNSISINAN